MISLFLKELRKITHLSKILHQKEKPFSFSCMNIQFDFKEDIFVELKKHVKENYGIEVSEMLVMSGCSINFKENPSRVFGESHNFLQVVQKEDGGYAAIAFLGTVQKQLL